MLLSKIDKRSISLDATRGEIITYNSNDIIPWCLAGDVDASNGIRYKDVYDSASTTYLQSPVPTSGTTGSPVVIQLPTLINPISITGMVLNTTGTQWLMINGGTTGNNDIRAHIDTTKNALVITSTNVTWQASGYIAVRYM